MSLLRLAAAGLLAVWGQAAVAGLPEPLASDPKAVPCYTGKVHPFPREAAYQDVFLPLAQTGLLLGQDVAADDGRVALLKERVERYGGKARVVRAAEEPCDTLVMIGETGGHREALGDKAPPPRAEGFLIHATLKEGKGLVFLKGHDFHGLLWAITSFSQLVTVENGRTVARAATILDFPDAPGRRGYTAMNDNDALDATWFAVRCLRPNVVIYRMARQMFGRQNGTWREDSRKHGAAWKAKVDAVAAALNPLRVEWYECAMPNHSTSEKDPAKNRQIRSKSEEDYGVLRDLAMYCAERGGHFGLLYDDFRFPLHPDDARDFGSAREADIYLINKLYAEVSARRPRFKLLFCPPFYWGPASDPSAAYGESRDEYLKAIGERLPKAVEIYWTGPRVKSTAITRDELAWITGMIKRKPVMWQNTPGTFHADVYYVYPTDKLTSWRDWYYDGFFNDIAFYAYNQTDCFTNLTLFDALWNRGAYAPAASSAEAAGKLVGPENSAKLGEGYGLLEAMDDYGWFTPTALAAKNVEDVRRRTGELAAFYDAAPAPLKAPWVSLGMFVDYRRRYLANLLKNPQLKDLAEADEIVRALAAKETGADIKGNCLALTPNDFRVARQPRHYGWKGAERRYVAWINGARSGAPSMEAGFQLPYPLTGDSRLTLAALDHNAKPPCRIRIQINGHTVFEGANPFEQERWTTHDFRVKGAFLRDGVVNSLRVENLEDADTMVSAPWFMLNYAVLRPWE